MSNTTESKVIILPETTRNPIQLIGRRAGICYGADITDPKKNYERGLDCLKSNHGRTLEFVNVESVLSGWSARVIREWYTHISGDPTRLQASTRYINYSKGFDYVIPDKIKNDPVALHDYEYAIKTVTDVANYLEKELKIPREDVANLFPLGMDTTIVDKRNLRNIIDMSHQRMCTRAYWEYRQLFKEYSNQLRAIDDEWAYIVDNYFKPKCELTGYCTEKKSCGRKPKEGE
jgi:thymidylate synthase (FAD)